MVALINRFIAAINWLTEWSGRAVSWLVFALVLLIVYDVSMRYFFHQGSVALQELEWHLFAFIFLVGAAYTLKHNAHVRVDVLFNSRFISDRGRLWINLLGGIGLLLPFCILVLVTSWPFVETAYIYGESSPDPGGLPYRFVVKSAIVFGFGLLILQGIADIARTALTLREQK